MKENVRVQHCKGQPMEKVSILFSQDYRLAAGNASRALDDDYTTPSSETTGGVVEYIPNT